MVDAIKNELKKTDKEALNVAWDLITDNVGKIKKDLAEAYSKDLSKKNLERIVMATCMEMDALIENMSDLKEGYELLLSVRGECKK